MANSKPQTKSETKPNKADTKVAGPAKSSIRKVSLTGTFRKANKSRRFVALPAKSVALAKKAFKNFTLSRFGLSKPPPHYIVHPRKATLEEKRRHTMAHQRKMIAQKLDSLKSAAKEQSQPPPPNNGMKLSLPKAKVKQLLPSYDAKKGTVILDDLLNLLERKRAGSEFYANGNPTLKGISVQTKVQQIINGIKGGKK